MIKGFLDRHPLFLAATTLIGTVIGAGILGIPYAIAKIGILPGFILIIALGLLLLLVNLAFGEVVLRTKELHQLTGYAQKYLGEKGKIAALCTLLITIYGALIAYLIGEGHTLAAILPFGSPMIYTLLFFALTFIIVYHGVKDTSKIELILITLLIVVIVLIGIFSLPDMKLANLNGGSLVHFMLPYGIVLFAYMGLPAIPELREVLAHNKRKLKNAIIIGSLTPIVLYLIFTVIVIATIGLPNFELLGSNERIASIALSIYANPILGLLANILAVLAMFTSFLTLAIALIDMYRRDFDVPRWAALLLTFSLPLIVVLLNLTSFLGVLAVTGAIAGGTEVVLTLIMFHKAKKMGNRKPEYTLKARPIISTILIILLAGGALTQVIFSLL